MSRNVSASDGVFRVMYKKTPNEIYDETVARDTWIAKGGSRPEVQEVIQVAGPYASKGVAKGQLSKYAKSGWYNRKGEYFLEESALTWVRSY